MSAPGAAPNADSGSAAQVIRLVAGRELGTRLRSKAFLISTGLTALALVLLAVGLRLFGGGSEVTVALTPAGSAVAAPLKAAAEALDVDVATRTVPDQAAGTGQVRDGEADALLLADGTRLRLVVQQDVDTGLQQAVDALAGRLVLAEQIGRLGGDPAEVGTAVAAARAQVSSLDPPRDYQPQDLALGVITGILIYLSLLLAGQSVAQGVVEEKTSRVVELLLATIRPWQLMAGKVLGIGTVGLVQVAVIGVVGLAAGLLTGTLSLSISAAGSTVGWLVAWYLLGFTLYALAFAAVGALVSRQEDVGGVVAPVMMLLIVGYVLGISVLPADPGNALCEVLSVIPVFAPTLMPMRLAMGGVPAWEAGLSVLLVLAMIPLMVWLSARIYRNAVLRTGARVRLRDALRAA